MTPHAHLSSPAVLIVDDDPAIRAVLTHALRRSGYAARTACCGMEGLAIARTAAFDLLLIDLRLPDIPGIDVIRRLRAETRRVPFVLISAFLTIATTVEAMRLGALHVMEKPINIDDLMSIVRTALTSGTPRLPSIHPRSAAQRWALHVFKACESEGDLRTIEDWATFVGVSYTSLCESCRLLGIKPHDARDLARMLRAVLKSAADRCGPEAVLDVSDRRTLLGLLARAGLADAPLGTVSAEEFLQRQRFVAAGNEGLQALQSMLSVLRLGAPGGTVTPLAALS